MPSKVEVAFSPVPPMYIGEETANAALGEVVPMPTLPFASMSKAVEVANPAVELEIVKSGTVPPAEPARESLAQGVVVPMPKLPCIVEVVVVPVTMSEPLTVAISVMESPKVALPSTVKVDAVVVERVTEPTEVRLLT